MIALVCGGRDYNNRVQLFRVLDTWHARRPITKIIHGAARGADFLAGEWARERGIPCDAYPADWKRFPVIAGFMRNAMMLREGNPEVCFVFPGGNGTADMKRRVIEKGVSCVTIFDDGSYEEPTPSKFVDLKGFRRE